VIIATNLSHDLNAYRILHSNLFDELADTSVSCEAVKIILPESKILDVKFVDDEEVLCLIQSGCMFFSRSLCNDLLK
jgi:hypothetical protein